MNITSLQCEYRKNPIGIDEKHPMFSWKTKLKEKNIMIDYSELSVWEQQSGIRVWEQKVFGGQRNSVKYEGMDLHPKTRYCWKIKIKLSKSSNIESEEQWFETGFLGDEWAADWISRTKKCEKPDIFRKHIFCKSVPKMVRCYATARGIYNIGVNGKKMKTDLLAPEFTSYDKLLQYQTYDAEGWFAEGDNYIEVTVADGWYCGHIGMTGENNQFGTNRALLLQIDMEYADGSKEIISSDSSWDVSAGKTCYSDLFIGEKQDARIELQEQQSEKVTVKNYGFQNLIGQLSQPIVVKQVLPAKRVIYSPKGEVILDFGQVLAGYIRMRVKGSFGDIISLIHSETLDKEGNFYFNISGEKKDQTDIYVLKGGREEIFQPDFTYHGFRYAKVEGYPGEVKRENFEALVIGNDLEETSTFSCSNTALTKLFTNTLWSQRSNMIAIPTDCPQREKAGWTGDIAVFASTACWNMNMAAFLRRWLKNVALDQRKDGQVPFLVPYIKSYDLFANMLFGSAEKVASCGWGDAAILVPWVLYQYYEDVRILHECYPMMKKWMDYVQTEVSDGLWTKGFHFGDWMLPSVSAFNPEHPESVFSSAYLTKEWVATCYYAYTTKRMQEICEVLGKAKEAEEYCRKNQVIRKAFANKYIHEDGTMDAEYQGVYVLALQMQMVPEHLVDEMTQHLVKMIKKNGDCLDTGFLSIPFLLDTLYEHGSADIAYQLLFQTKCPSWLYEVEQGATTIWESWNAVLSDKTVTPMSMNHYAYGCVVDFIMRRIVGIVPVKPGFKRIRIQPDFSCGLEWAKGSYDSIHGKISVDWKRENEKVRMQVVIPPYIVAEVKLGEQIHVVGCGNYEFN